MKNLLLLLMVLLFVTCRKESAPYYLEALKNCIEESMKNAPKEPGREYVSCKINGKKLLLSDGFDDNEQYHSVGASYVTSGPIWSPDDSVTQYFIKIGFRKHFDKLNSFLPLNYDNLFLMINTKNQLSPVEYIDQYVNVGELPLKNIKTGETTDPELLEGFELSYWCTCDCSQNGYDPGSTIGYTSIYKEQNGYLRCTNKQRTDLGDKVFYRLEFEFEYESYVEHEFIYFKDGKMVVEFELEK